MKAIFAFVVLLVSSSVLADDFSSPLREQLRRLSAATSQRKEGGDRSSADIVVEKDSPSSGSGAIGPLSEVAPESSNAAPQTTLSVLKLTADWCGACRTETVSDWLKQSGWSVTPLDAFSAAGAAYKAETFPTFVVLQNGNEVERYAGLDTQEFAPILERVNASVTQNPQAATVDVEDSTPHSQVAIGLELLQPKPGERFADFGCDDGRWLIAAVEGYDVTAVGVEIDRQRALTAMQKVADAGVQGSVEIVQGDATKVEVDADIASVFLFPDLLAELAPQLSKMRRVVSYRHPIPGMQGRKQGNFWVYERQSAPAVATTVATAVTSGPVIVGYRPYAIYMGRKYYGANASCCGMCAEIMRQIWAREHLEPIYGTSPQQVVAGPQRATQACGRAGCSSCSTGGCARSGCASGGCSDFDYDDDD